MADQISRLGLSHLTPEELDKHLEETIRKRHVEQDREREERRKALQQAESKLQEKK